MEENLKNKAVAHDSLILDVDGTLWDSTDVIAASWTNVVKRYPEAKLDDLTAEELKKQFGRPNDVIAANLMPHLSVEDRTRIINACVEQELIDLHETPGTFYPQLAETIKELSTRYKLLINSNCGDGYIETFLEVSGLGDYITDFVCPDTTGMVKGPNNRWLMERNGLRNPVYVGDIQGDKNSADEAGIAFCYASYGFGDVDQYDYKIDCLADLAKIF